MEHQEIEELVNHKLAHVLSNPSFKAAMHNEIATQIAVSNLEHCRASRPVQTQEILCMPQPYNARGDIAVIVNRHHHNPEHSLSMLVHYSNFDEVKNTVNFSFTLFQENLFDKSKTKFCSPDSELEKEIHRQLAAVFLKEMLGKNALWTLVTVPYEQARHFLPQIYATHAPKIAELPPAPPPPPEAQRVVVKEPPVTSNQYDPPIATKQVSQEAGGLDDMFPAML